MLRCQDRTPLPFQRPHRLIVVDGDHENVRFLGGCLEISNVTNMKQIEATIGKRYSATGFMRLPDPVCKAVT
jgi:hypothetical protein